MKGTIDDKDMLVLAGLELASLTRRLGMRRIETLKVWLRCVAAEAAAALVVSQEG